MRHNVMGKKLGRNTLQRKALYKGLVNALIDHGQIATTVVKAKQVRRFAEKLVTLGKKNTVAARRQAGKQVLGRKRIQKLFDEIAPHYADRQGGYTRITKLGKRQGDGAEMALIQFMPDDDVLVGVPVEKEETVQAESQEKQEG